MLLCCLWSRRNPPWRVRDPPCIPGLIPQAFTEASRHRANAPTLQQSDVDATTGECHFEWKAVGSDGGTYAITAEGILQVQVDASGEIVGRGLKVRCSCPNGKRQAAVSLEGNKIVVCKHAAAALHSVLDESLDTRPIESVSSKCADKLKIRRRRSKKGQERNKIASFHSRYTV